MNDYLIFIGTGCFFAGLLIAYWLKGKLAYRKIKAAEEEAAQFLGESQKKADALLKEADLEIKDRLFKLKSEFDAETKETRAELKNRETRLVSKEENIDRKIEQFERRDRELARKERHLTKREGKLERKELEYSELIEALTFRVAEISRVNKGWFVESQLSLHSVQPGC